MSKHTLDLVHIVAQLREGIRSRLVVTVPPQSDSPVMLLSVRHDTKDLFSAGQIANVSDLPVAAYKVGWLIDDGSGTPTLHSGDWIALVSPMTHGQVLSVPSQRLPAKAFREGTALVFFIREVQFANGKTWRASLGESRQTATRVAPEVPKVPRPESHGHPSILLAR
jgi:hypothetical protein